MQLQTADSNDEAVALEVHVARPNCGWRAKNYRVRVWGDECVVFDAHTLKTHSVGMPAGYLLELLSSSSQICPEPDLLQAFSETAELAVSDAFPYAVNALDQFAALGLVECVLPIAIE